MRTVRLFVGNDEIECIEKVTIADEWGARSVLAAHLVDGTLALIPRGDSVEVRSG